MTVWARTGFSHSRGDMVAGLQPHRSPRLLAAGAVLHRGGGEARCFSVGLRRCHHSTAIPSCPHLLGAKGGSWGRLSAVTGARVHVLCSVWSGV